ncbi:M48 family metallopeptidase [Algihabitans albus]|uniref:M48 family metallopeptidase n=1 Tax=Algihabitans albus TaxID=2164067 RepID=UPI000E5CC59A|nr:SprT family zinc-dependent metalloprotease [Algihabitans albus]
MSRIQALLKTAPPPVAAPPTVEIDGRTVPIAVRVNARARRIILRLAPGTAADGGDGLSLTLPSGVALSEGLAFVDRSRGWIAARLKRLPAPLPFTDGALLPILGEEHLVKHAPWSRRPPWKDKGILWVGGAAEHLARRITDHLKTEARREITSRARAKAAKLVDRDISPDGKAARKIQPQGRRLGRITLRDTRSRWGSCSQRGDLNFSWRLVFAPLPVLDYVVAHEVAHLVHLDHSPAFWRLCEALSDEPGWTKSWLRRHGAELLRYGG